MKRSDLAAAAFWGEGFCLDCEARLTDAGEEAGCTECGSDAVYSAAFLLRVFDWIEPEGDDDVA